ncbi:MAG: ATP-binding protein [Acetobacteraceae bacterium]
MTLTLVALAIVWGSIAVSLHSQYKATMLDAWRDADNLTRAFGENIARIVDGVDQTLINVRDHYQHDRAGFTLQEWLQGHRLSTVPHLALVLTNASGQVTETTAGPAPGDLTAAETAPFRPGNNEPADVLLLGDPVFSRITGAPAIVFSRKLIAPDGTMAGAISALLNPAELSRFYETIAIDRGSITLLNLQGIVLTRAPGGEQMVGRRVDTDFYRQMRDGPPQGRHSAISGLDGQHRIYSYRRFTNPGLLLTVGLSKEDVFAAYHFNRNVSVGAAVLVSIGIVSASIILFRQRQGLVRSNRILGITLENMTQGIQMVEPGGRIGVINSRAIELLGIPQSLLDRKPTFPQLVKWQIDTGEFGDPRSYPEGLRKTLDAGGIVASVDTYERTRANGTVLEITTKPMPGGGAVRTYTDITERKQTEAALAAARDAAEVSGRARMEFLAMMSHEIRTPMNSIIGFASLLMDMPLSVTVQQYVRTIRQSGNHLLQLINDILDLSKLDAGKLQLEDEAFDLREEIAQTVELLTGQAQEKQLTLKAILSPHVPQRIRGDSGRLRQILINLIGNGLKFSSVGGVTVYVDLFKDDTDMNRLSFKVVDTGIGIPREKVCLLFHHFSQVNDSQSRHYGGTGLGLAISKRLVEQMGGSIGVESEPGRGSTFYFDLPLRPAEDVTATHPAGVSLRILLADDNASNQAVIARMLERQGHRVDTVGNGLEAVEAVRTRPYDLIVMDIAMPEMDGLMAAEAIRDLTGRRGRVPIIGLTANAAGTAEADCNRAGMNAFMTKPVTPDILERAINRAMTPIMADVIPGP